MPTLRDPGSRSKQDATHDLEEGARGRPSGRLLLAGAGVGLDEQSSTAPRRPPHTHNSSKAHLISTLNTTTGSVIAGEARNYHSSVSKELLSLQGLPIPPSHGFTVGGRRQRTKDPALEFDEEANVSRLVSPFDTSDTSGMAPVAVKVDLEISAGAFSFQDGPAERPATVTPKGSRMAGNAAVALSPAMTQALDDAAETRKKLARERGRRKAEARMKELAASCASPASPSLDEQHADGSKGSDASVPRSDHGPTDGQGDRVRLDPKRDLDDGRGGGPLNPLLPLRGARSVRSAMERKGVSSCRESTPAATDESS